MKFKIVVFIITTFCITAIANLNAQSDSNLTSVKYRVVFRDKQGSPYSTEHPEMFLSAKSLSRRTRQHIPVLENDLPVNPHYIHELTKSGAKVLNRSRWMNSVVIETSDQQLADKIQKLQFVKSIVSVAKVYQVNAQKEDEQAPGAPSSEGRRQSRTQKKSSNYYGAARNQIEMLNGESLHHLGYKGEGMTIAVLDAGFRKMNQITFFDSLRLSGRLLGSKDFVAGGTSVFDDDAHGTAVLSTMAAYIPDSYVGTAPLASYWLIRTEDAASEYPVEEDNWISGAEFADSVGAEIINSSLGYTRFDDTTMSYRYADLNGKSAWITKGAVIAASKGILVVSSAGNSGAGSWRYVGVPADGDSILSVGAVNAIRDYAPFSSQGPTSDGRVKPNIAAMGQDIQAVTSSGTIAAINGTSFSSPVMAGMVACLWEAHPNATAMQVLKAIEQSADQYEKPDGRKGFGIPDMMKAHRILTANESNTILADSIVNLYFNPFRNGITIEFFSLKDQNLNIKIKTNSGKRIARESYKVVGGKNNLIQIENIRRLKEGIYNVSIKAGKKNFSRKITKS